MPGLVLAAHWPATAVTLLDAQQKRCRFLEVSIDRLGLTDRVTVAEGRAEELGRGALRGAFSLVTARGFAPPAVTAECGAPFLASSGLLAVAEPPGGAGERWPAAGVGSLGLVEAGLVTSPASVRVFRQAGPLAGTYPRRIGLPAKRPLWGDR